MLSNLVALVAHAHYADNHSPGSTCAFMLFCQRCLSIGTQHSVLALSRQGSGPSGYSVRHEDALGTDQASSIYTWQQLTIRELPQLPAQCIQVGIKAVGLCGTLNDHDQATVPVLANQVWGQIARPEGQPPTDRHTHVPVVNTLSERMKLQRWASCWWLLRAGMPPHRFFTHPFVTTPPPCTALALQGLHLVQAKHTCCHQSAQLTLSPHLR